MDGIFFGIFFMLWNILWHIPYALEYSLAYSKMLYLVSKGEAYKYHAHVHHSRLIIQERKTHTSSFIL